MGGSECSSSEWKESWFPHPGVRALVSDNNLFFQPVRLWNQGPLTLSQAIPKSQSGCFSQERLQNNMWFNCFEHIAMVFTSKLSVWFLDTKLSSWHRVGHKWANKDFGSQNWDSCTQFHSQTGPWKILTAELCQGMAWESLGQHR